MKGKTLFAVVMSAMLLSTMASADVLDFTAESAEEANAVVALAEETEIQLTNGGAYSGKDGGYNVIIVTAVGFQNVITPEVGKMTAVLYDNDTKLATSTLIIVDDLENISSISAKFWTSDIEDNPRWTTEWHRALTKNSNLTKVKFFYDSEYIGTLDLTVPSTGGDNTLNNFKNFDDIAQTTADLKALIAEAHDGDTFDLFGKTYVLDDCITINKNITIKNATFDISGTVGSKFAVDGKATFEEINFTGSNFECGLGIILNNYGSNATADVTINNCNFNLEYNNHQWGNGCVFYSNEFGESKFTINNSNFNLNGIGRFSVNSEINLTSDNKDNTIVMKNGEHAFRNAYGTISGYTIEADGFKNGIKNSTANCTLSLTNGTNVTFKNMGEYDVQLSGGAGLVVDETSSVTMGKINYVASINGIAYNTLADALEAANKVDGAVTVELINDVEWKTGAAHGSTPFVTADSNAVVTINGNGNTIIATGDGIGSVRAANGTLLTFNNVKFVDNSVSYAENAWELTYLEFAGKLAFNNCEFKDEIMLTDDNHTTPNCEAKFADCSFESNESQRYAVWVAHGTANFSNCYFTGYRAVKVHEAYGTDVKALNLSGCTFENITEKPAVVIGTLDSTTNVSINNCIVKNAKTGDQGTVLVESDTPLANFNYRTNVITPGYVTDSDIWGEAYAVINESLAVELYAGDELLGTTELRDGDFGGGDMIDGNAHTVTWRFKYVDSDAGNDYWTGNYFYAKPGKKPTKVVLYVDGVKIAENFVGTAGNNGEALDFDWESRFDSIGVKFDEDTAKATASSRTYAIKVNSANEINKLNSADLTFAFTADTEMSYEIIGTDDVTVTSIGDRYMFSYNDGDSRETASEITIGYVTITGYGTYTFAVDTSADTNEVHATTKFNNVVDSYKPNGGGNYGSLVIDGSNINGTIEEPKFNLTVNVSFPNEVKANNADYQNMTVTIAGNKKTDTFKLGENMVNGKYVVEAELTANTSYTVTVSGAGYRTARYTVAMTEDKVLNFWNNAMDEDYMVEVEKGNANSAKQVTFLAGDIVKNNKIDIYDLNAVVSYFGTITDTDAYSEYAQYDLDRNGVIDSKDVAYVLASWGF